MIASLRGTLVDHRVDCLVVECAGVGYRVTILPGMVAGLGGAGEMIHLHVHHHIREDHQALYGFSSAAERDCFETLLGAHGVGPALALAILSVHRPRELAQVLAAGDLTSLCQVPGVGKKTAARLLVELRDRLDLTVLDLDGSAVSSASSGGDSGVADAALSQRAVVRQALAELGYNTEEVRHALDGQHGGLDESELLRASLQKLAAVR